KILPWMLQSLFMPKVALLISAGAKAQLEGKDPTQCLKALAMRKNVLALVNDLLKREMYIEAIYAVVYLWYWGEYENLWAYMNGVVEMLRVQNSLEEIRNELLVQMLVLTDYQLACSFDRDLVLLKPQAYKLKAQPLAVFYPEAFNSFLLDFSRPFVDIREKWGFDLVAAQMLNAVKDFTVAILSFSLTDCKISIQDILTKAHSIHSRLFTFYHLLNLSSLTTETSLITTTVHFAAFTYVTSILTLTPLSSLEPPAYFFSSTIQQTFHTNICSVFFSRWKQMPGIFLWILFVASSTCGNNPLGKYLKRKMTVAAFSMSMEDFDLARSCLDGFWRVGA
ncbi:hypothetical protein B0O99DRAFT_521390, partial [Bisporella sp. PMI_857]